MARALNNIDPLRKEYTVLKFLMDGRISFKVTVPKEMSAAETTQIGASHFRGARMIWHMYSTYTRGGNGHPVPGTARHESLSCVICYGGARLTPRALSRAREGKPGRGREVPREPEVRRRAPGDRAAPSCLGAGTDAPIRT